MSNNDVVIEILNSLIKRIDSIDKDLETIKCGMAKLGRHIDFVEDVADAVQHPINRLFNIDICRRIK